MSGAPRQGKFERLQDEIVEALVTSEEEDSASSTPGNISVESTGDTPEEEEGGPAAETPEEEEEGLLEDTLEEEEEGPNMATYRDEITFDIVTGDLIDMEFQRILCGDCMNEGFYEGREKLMMETNIP